MEEASVTARRSAVVTGGSSGIGLAIARALHADGYELTLAARKRERLDAAQEVLDCHVVEANVAEEEDCARLVAEHVDRYGGLDVLVNSAGTGSGGSLAETATKNWDRQHNVNLRGAFLVTREALPHLRQSRGYVVSLASIHGLRPAPGLGAYGASKAGLISFMQTLLREEAEAGVRATAICPGYVNTPLAEWTGLPGDEMIQPEDCAELVSTLLRLSPAVRIPVIEMERKDAEV